jgi:hypothetical protein
MAEDTNVDICGKRELLDIFSSEEDKKGTDLLKMSNYFDVFVSKIDTNLDTKGKWEVVINPGALLGRIAAVIKSGFDISEMNMLIADTSHFSQEIVDCLKKGIYHIGQSKEVAGNFRPVVLDENEHLVKFVTLKKAINPSEVLSDMTNLSMQLSLKNISAQIEAVGRDIQGISEFVRRETLSNKFIYARDKIMLAASADGVQQERYLMDADTYLMEGLADLYADINAEVEKLAMLSGPFRSLKAADTLLAHINEDMQMIPRYVGLRVYLFNLRRKTADASRVLGEYRYHLENLSERNIGQEKYTGFEMIHRYYPYSDSDTNFWLYEPQKMLTALKSYNSMIEQSTDELYYIDMEEL